jgi:hypothetical protein
MLWIVSCYICLAKATKNDFSWHSVEEMIGCIFSNLGFVSLNESKANLWPNLVPFAQTTCMV